MAKTNATMGKSTLNIYSKVNARQAAVPGMKFHGKQDDFPEEPDEMGGNYFQLIQAGCDMKGKKHITVALMGWSTC